MRRVLPLLVLLSLAFAPAPLPKRERAQKVAASMEGTWQGQVWTLEVTADRMTFSRGRVSSPYGLAVDRSKHPPTFDLIGLRGGGAHWLGIYRVDGDVLTTSRNGAQDGRPTGFEGADKGRFHEVFRRVEKQR